MKTIKPDFTYSTHSRFNTPNAIVEPGEEFCVHTELCSGRWLQSINDRFSPEKSEGCNPSVCIGVSGAEPGDMLAVHIREIVPDSIGYTGFDGQDGTMKLPWLISRTEMGLVTKTVEIKDGFVEWSPKIKLPVSPMIGTLGAAPAQEEIMNSKGGIHGGNMDVQEVAAGTTVYLPVEVDLALLHVGDCHAVQGDGEINEGGGIECRTKVIMQVDVLKGLPRRSCIRMENSVYIMTVCCERSLEESFYTAAGEMLDWLVEYGFSPEEGYLLMGQILEARATQYVNPTRTYICKMPKRFLTP